MERNIIWNCNNYWVWRLYTPYDVKHITQYNKLRINQNRRQGQIINAAVHTWYIPHSFSPPGCVCFVAVILWQVSGNSSDYLPIFHGIVPFALGLYHCASLPMEWPWGTNIKLIENKPHQTKQSMNLVDISWGVLKFWWTGNIKGKINQLVKLGFTSDNQTGDWLLPSILTPDVAIKPSQLVSQVPLCRVTVL